MAQFVIDADEAHTQLDINNARSIVASHIAEQPELADKFKKGMPSRGWAVRFVKRNKTTIDFGDTIEDSDRRVAWSTFDNYETFFKVVAENCVAAGISMVNPAWEEVMDQPFAQPIIHIDPGRILVADESNLPIGKHKGKGKKVVHC